MLKQQIMLLNKWTTNQDKFYTDRRSEPWRTPASHSISHNVHQQHTRCWGQLVFRKLFYSEQQTPSQIGSKHTLLPASQITSLVVDFNQLHFMFLTNDAHQAIITYCKCDGFTVSNSFVFLNSYTSGVKNTVTMNGLSFVFPRALTESYTTYINMCFMSMYSPNICNLCWCPKIILTVRLIRQCSFR